ncbi:MAG: hypothetical protein ACP5LB_02900 [Candidatus Bathyarchaeia archaeon]
MATRNLFLLKAVLTIQLSKLGLDVAICHKCGKIFMKTDGTTICKECQHQLLSSFSA